MFNCLCESKSSFRYTVINDTFAVTELRNVDSLMMIKWNTDFCLIQNCSATFLPRATYQRNRKRPVRAKLTPKLRYYASLWTQTEVQQQQNQCHYWIPNWEWGFTNWIIFNHPNMNSNHASTGIINTITVKNNWWNKFIHFNWYEAYITIMWALSVRACDQRKTPLVIEICFRTPEKAILPWEAHLSPTTGWLPYFALPPYLTCIRTIGWASEMTNHLLCFRVFFCLHFEQSFLLHCLESTDFHRHLRCPPIRCTLTNSIHLPNLSQHQITYNQSLNLINQ